MNVLKRVLRGTAAAPQAQKRAASEDAEPPAPNKRVKLELYTELDRAQTRDEKTRAWRHALRAIEARRATAAASDAAVVEDATNAAVSTASGADGAAGAGSVAGDTRDVANELNDDTSYSANAPFDSTFAFRSDASSESWDSAWDSDADAADSSPVEDAEFGSAAALADLGARLLPLARADIYDPPKGENNAPDSAALDFAAAEQTALEQTALEQAVYEELVADLASTQVVEDRESEDAALHLSAAPLDRVPVRSLEEELDKPRPLWQLWTPRAGNGVGGEAEDKIPRSTSHDSETDLGSETREDDAQSPATSVSERPELQDALPQEVSTDASEASAASDGSDLDDASEASEASELSSASDDDSASDRMTASESESESEGDMETDTGLRGAESLVSAKDDERVNDSVSGYGSDEFSADDIADLSKHDEHLSSVADSHDLSNHSENDEDYISDVDADEFGDSESEEERVNQELEVQSNAETGWDSDSDCYDDPSTPHRSCCSGLNADIVVQADEPDNGPSSVSGVCDSVLDIVPVEEGSSDSEEARPEPESPLPHGAPAHGDSKSDAESVSISDSGSDSESESVADYAFEREFSARHIAKDTSEDTSSDYGSDKDDFSEIENEDEREDLELEKELLDDPLSDGDEDPVWGSDPEFYEGVCAIQPSFYIPVRMETPRHEMSRGHEPSPIRQVSPECASADEPPAQSQTPLHGNTDVERNSEYDQDMDGFVTAVLRLNDRPDTSDSSIQTPNSREKELIVVSDSSSEEEQDAVELSELSGSDSEDALASRDFTQQSEPEEAYELEDCDPEQGFEVEQPHDREHDSEDERELELNEPTTSTCESNSNSTPNVIDEQAPREAERGPTDAPQAPLPSTPARDVKYFDEYCEGSESSSDSAPEECTAKVPPPATWEAFWTAQENQIRRRHSSHQRDDNDCIIAGGAKVYVYALKSAKKSDAEKRARKERKGHSKHHHTSHRVKKHHHHRSHSDGALNESSGRHHKRKHLRWHDE